mmetsp:Transcript_14211/g.39128  ORF Transcript_14211/g.39128 Transcript_14211/m.39128 type:complete len:257 (+) Transcript_14211:1803-2573(+)
MGFVSCLFTSTTAETVESKRLPTRTVTRLSKWPVMASRERSEPFQKRTSDVSSVLWGVSGSTRAFPICVVGDRSLSTIFASAAVRNFRNAIGLDRCFVTTTAASVCPESCSIGDGGGNARLAPRAGGAPRAGAAPRTSAAPRGGAAPRAGGPPRPRSDRSRCSKYSMRSSWARSSPFFQNTTTHSGSLLCATNGFTGTFLILPSGEGSSTITFTNCGVWRLMKATVLVTCLVTEATRGKSLSTGACPSDLSNGAEA